MLELSKKQIYISPMATRPAHRIIAYLSLSMLAFSSCTYSQSDYKGTGERFIQAYYLQSSPKKALELTTGPALEKLNHELSLLKGIPDSHSSEQPKMSYKIFSCENLGPQTAQCGYQLDIQMDRLRIRKGLLTLKKLEGQWLVIQFVEEPYESLGPSERLPTCAT